MKRTIAFFLVLLLLFSLNNMAFADDTVYTEGYFYYTFADGSITIVGYFGHETEVTVPAMIAGYPVNAVSADAFSGTSVQQIYLPDTVTAYQGGLNDHIGVVFDANTDHPFTPTDEGTDAAAAEAEKAEYAEGNDDSDVSAFDAPTQDSVEMPSMNQDSFSPSDGEVTETEVFTEVSDPSTPENHAPARRCVWILGGGLAVLAFVLFFASKRKKK